jgi:hypothetical protein
MKQKTNKPLVATQRASAPSGSNHPALRASVGSAKPSRPVRQAGRREYDLFDATFVQAWQQSKSVAEVMERLRIERHLAIARAARLRTRGVKLKKMPVGRPKRLSDQEVRELRQLAIDLA